MRKLLTVLLLLACALPLAAQADKADVRRGNREFRKGRFAQADIRYRKALLKDSTSLAANYNLASVQYRQGDFDGASASLAKVQDKAVAAGRGADAFFNAGDAALQKQDYKGAVEAFMQSLVINPDDLDAKENYIYALKKLQDQQQNGGGGDGDDQDQDQDQNNQDQNQDNQDQDQNNQDQDQDNQDQEKPQEQPQREEISPQQAAQMLQAIQAKEKETQDKVEREKAEALKTRNREKNW